jgi:hypothetical protein
MIKKGLVGIGAGRRAGSEACRDRRGVTKNDLFIAAKAVGMKGG